MENSGYKYGTVATMFQELKRLNYKHTLEVVEPKIKEAARYALRKLCQNNLSKVSVGKEPILSKDLNRVCKAIPDGYAKRTANTSLWLCTLSCGLRCISMNNIKLKDIIKVVELED